MIPLPIGYLAGVWKTCGDESILIVENEQEQDYWKQWFKILSTNLYKVNKHLNAQGLDSGERTRSEIRLF